jgi:hypothetical protein
VGRKRLALLGALLLLSGCGTISDLANLGDTEELLGAGGPHIFGGTRLDYFRSLEAEDTLWMSWSRVYVADILFSLPLDAVLFPFTLIWAIIGLF